LCLHTGLRLCGPTGSTTPPRWKLWGFWGHININVSNLDASIEFYEKIDFEVFLLVIPYLELAEIAICIYPDGILIELIQLHLDKWSA